MGGFESHVREQILTAKGDSDFNPILPILVAEHARNELERVLYMVDGLSLDARVEVFTARIRWGETSTTFPAIVAKHAPDKLGRVFDVVDTFRLDVREKMFTANGRGDFNPILPVIMAEHAPAMFARVLDMVGRLSLDTKVEVLMAKVVEGNSTTTLLIFVSEHAPDAIEIVLDVVDTFPSNVQVKIFIAKCHGGLGGGGAERTHTFPISIVHHNKNILRKFFDLVNRLGAMLKRKYWRTTLF
jgi:hypothetical protein